MINGDKVALGPLCTEHLEQAREWRNNFHIRRWCRQLGLISDADQEDWYERQRNDPSIKMFAIHCMESDKDHPKYKDFIGVCGLTSIDLVNGRAEFSLYVGLEYQGMKYAKEALKLLLRFGFEDLHLNIIWGETFSANPAKFMFEKLGFKKEGTRRDFYFKEGRYIDAHLYSVKREEVAWNG